MSSIGPTWAAKAIVRAVWVAAGESPKWIATRTDALLREFDEAFEIADWRTSEDGFWQGPPDVLAGIVRGYATVDSYGDVVPESGYSFTVFGKGPGLGLDVQISAGATTPGRRIPRHSLTIELRQLAAGGVTSETADTVCAAVTRVWEPATVKLSDSSVDRIARRGNWKIGVGYRMWISAEVGPIHQLAEGLSSMPLATGTLISAPDDWPAERVVGAMTETLAANGLDEIPHGT